MPFSCSALLRTARASKAKPLSVHATLRRFSAQASNGNLPLRGVRVLDMTRVLAGVRSLYSILSMV